MTSSSKQNTFHTSRNVAFVSYTVMQMLFPEILYILIVKWISAEGESQGWESGEWGKKERGCFMFNWRWDKIFSAGIAKMKGSIRQRWKGNDTEDAASRNKVRDLSLMRCHTDIHLMHCRWALDHKHEQIPLHEIKNQNQS